MKFVKFGLLALGLAILVSAVKNVGVETIASNIRACGWRLIPILLVYPFVFAFSTAGWAYSFPEQLPKRIPFSSLYNIRVIGEMLNSVIPFSASLGGEPIKAELLKRRHGVPLGDGYASVLIVHTTFWISLNLFVIGGILVTLNRMPLTPVLWKSVLAFLIVLGAIAVLLIIGLKRGIFENVYHLGERMKWWGSDSLEKKDRFLSLDKRIKDFYTRNPRRFILSALFNFLGWMAGIFEVYFTANALGMQIGLLESWLLEALIQVLRIITFFIPASVGVQEGGILLIFGQFGFGGPVSLTFAIIRRIRELIFIAIGLLLWSFTEDKPKIKK